MKVLVSGWFSFETMGATAGDILVRNVVCDWLRDAGVPFDVANAAPFGDELHWEDAKPKDYSHVIFVCGPFGNGWPITPFLEHFRTCRLVGVNVTMLEPLERWNPFDILFERDSSSMVRPDLTFLTRTTTVPVVGLVLRDEGSEYGDRHLFDESRSLIEAVVGSRPMATVRIDTRLDQNRTGLRSAAEIESLIARVDVVVTTRLHGLVLALKNDTPVVALDPIRGGGKLSLQAQAVDWPVAFRVDTATRAELIDGLEYCLTPDAEIRAAKSAEHARVALGSARTAFLEALCDVRRSEA